MHIAARLENLLAGVQKRLFEGLGAAFRNYAKGGRPGGHRFHGVHVVDLADPAPPPDGRISVGVSVEGFAGAEEYDGRDFTIEARVASAKDRRSRTFPLEGAGNLNRAMRVGGKALDGDWAYCRWIDLDHARRRQVVRGGLLRLEGGRAVPDPCFSMNGLEEAAIWSGVANEMTALIQPWLPPMWNSPNST